MCALVEQTNIAPKKKLVMHNGDGIKPSLFFKNYENNQNLKFLKSKELVSRLDQKFSKPKNFFKIRT